MKYVFCSMMFDDIEADIKMSKEPNAVSGHRFQKNILRGLVQNHADIYVLNVPRVRHYPDYPQKYLKEKDFIFEDRIVGKSIGFSNLYLISYLSQYQRFKQSLNQVISGIGKEQCVLITFNSYLVQSINMIKARNNFKNIKTCDVIGDLHGRFGLLREHATLKERLVDMYGRIEDRYAKKFDYYVFLSKYMREVFPCNDNQHTVVEGIYNDNGVLPQIAGAHQNNSNEKTLVYGGSLDIEYDIEHLVNAFSMTHNNKYRLFIAGNGNGLELVRSAEKKDARIRYLGMLSPSELQKYQMNATALISPRMNNHSYVKYSFPSKTMECLALGKPYIAHKLDSEPDEYSGYIQYAEETDEGLAQKIMEVLSMPEDQRIEIGRRSREFILQEKNPRTMCKRIIDLCEG